MNESKPIDAPAIQPFPARFRQRLVRPSSRSDRPWKYGAIALLLLHIPLALMLRQYSTLSTLHATAVFILGIGWAISAPHQPIRVAYVAAYITGAEVLWRMTNAQIFWEFGKYAIACILIVAILRSRRLKGVPAMFGYFTLLVPSIAVIVERLGASRAQGHISFNLSGPFAMMVAAWFFSREKFSVEQIQRIFLVAVAPVLGIAAIAFYSINTAKEISFNTESNFVSSAGFGPNQVSAALGLGALFAFLFVLLGKSSGTLKLMMLVSMLFMAIQSALTFSRGGLYNFAGAAALASVYLLRDARTRRNLIFVVITVFVLGTYIVLPRLETLTGGMLVSRFSDTDSTNRIEIISNDLRVWQENPIFGVGPGGSKFASISTAHTEFARLFAEHGTFGLMALVLLLFAAAKSVRSPKTIKGKAIALCMVGWSFLYMLNAAMRIVAPAFTFGLAFAIMLPETSLSVKASALRFRRRWQRRVIFQRPVPTGQIQN
jgi:hypothetical protein